MSATPPPGGSWARIDSRADLDHLIEQSLDDCMVQIWRALDAEPDAEMRAELARHLPSIRRQLQARLDAEMDGAWAGHARREGKLT